MRYLRKFVQRVGLVSTLLIVGVLGGLMVPLPSEALTVTIDGQTVSMNTTVTCDSGYNLCRRIAPGTYNNWVVGDYSGTNQARIMIGDNSAANSLDLLKMSGITFTPAGTNTGSRTTTVVITHTYNVGGGNPQGDYSWGYGMAGHFDPPSGENVVDDRVQQTGQGNFAGTTVPLGSGVDTGVLKTPTTNNLNGSVTKTATATVVRANCNTGNARCAPTVTQTITITVVGQDTLRLSDSFTCAGGTCRPVGQVVPIPPLLYALMLKLDPNAPNDINLLSAWLFDMGQKYLNKPKQLQLLAFLIKELDKWLAKTVPGTCPEIQEQINAVIADDVFVELANCNATPEGCEPATPGKGTIKIVKFMDTNTFNTGTSGFEATGEGMSNFSLSANGSLAGIKFFNNLLAGETAGLREIKEISFPDPHVDGEESVWRLDSVVCDGLEGQVQLLYQGIEGPLVGVRVNYVDHNQTLTCFFDNHHSHGGDDSPFGHPHPPSGGD